MFKNILLEHLKSYEAPLVEDCDCEDDKKKKSDEDKKPPFVKKGDGDKSDKKDKSDDDEDDDDDEDVNESIRLSLTSDEAAMSLDEAVDLASASDVEELEETASFDKLTIGGKVIRPSKDDRAALEALFTEAETSDVKTLMTELTKDIASYNRIVRYAKTVMSDN